jgi:DNA-binding GntR family transcriptional regulator
MREKPTLPDPRGQRCYNPNLRIVNATMAKTEKERKLSASQRVELHIKKAIYSGTLRPRERIIEEDIASRLKCSRGPVREALLRLERDGLVVTIPRRGTFIHDISSESIDVVFRIRGKLEGLCVRYMREEMRPKDESTLREMLRRMKVAAAKADDEQFLQADMKLHQTIWKLSRREQLYQTLNSVMNPFIFMVARAFSSRVPIMDRYADHERYVDMVLTAPLARVERQVELYFQQLHESLFGHNAPLFFAPNEKSWTQEELEVQ